MPDSQLMTDWICIATEGETTDGREIKRHWLTESAELYSPSLYTALLWPEHADSGETAGEVLALKAEENDERVMKLYARLCPSLALIQANQQGRLLFCSCEFTADGNFRNTGKTYLEGLGVTNTPASVGTDRMRFGRLCGLAGSVQPLVITDVKTITERQPVTRAKKNNEWRSIFGIKKQFAEEPAETETTEPEDKLQRLAQTVAALETRLATLEKATEQTEAAVEGVQEEVTQVKQVVDTREFAALLDSLPRMMKSFSELDAMLTPLPKKFSLANAVKDNTSFSHLV